MTFGETTLFLLVFGCWMCLYRPRESRDTVTTPKSVQVTSIENVIEEADVYEPPEPPAYVDVIK